MKHLPNISISALFSICLMTILLVSGCGQDYLTKKEQVKLHLMIERAKTAQEQFETPTLQTAQVVLKVIQDANPFIKKTVEKAPEAYYQELSSQKTIWQKQVLDTTALAQEKDMEPFYNKLTHSIQLTLSLLQKIRDIDQSM
jgi:hypothetical protein